MIKIKLFISGYLFMLNRGYLFLEKNGNHDQNVMEYEKGVNMGGLYIFVFDEVIAKVVIAIIIKCR